MSPGQSDLKAYVLTLLHSTFQVSKGPTHSTHPGSRGPASEPKLGNHQIYRHKELFLTGIECHHAWPAPTSGPARPQTRGPLSRDVQPSIIMSSTDWGARPRKAGLHASGSSGVNLALVAPPHSWLGQGSGFKRREGKSTNWKPGVLGSAWKQK